MMKTVNWNFSTEHFHRVLIHRKTGSRMYCTDATGEPLANYTVFGIYLHNGKHTGCQLAEAWEIDKDQNIPSFISQSVADGQKQLRSIRIS